MKIAVYSICKNESKFVNRFMDSCHGADGVFVLDTGSSDDTFELLKSRGASVSCKHYKTFRFDQARNDSLALVPSDYDVCVCIDLDEVLVEGWREKVESSFQMGINHLEYLYAWSMKDENTPNYSFRYDKIHARHGFEWQKPIHEHIVCTVEKKSYFLTTLLVKHFPDSSKSRGFYIDLLKLATEEMPLDSRNSFYYARELYYAKRYNEAIVEFERYLKLDSAKWNLERATACSMMAKCYQSTGQLYAAEKSLIAGCSEALYEREPWCDLSDFYRITGNHALSYACATKALSIKHNARTFLNVSGAWADTPHDLASISSYYMGLKDESLKHALYAFRNKPDDERLINNYKVISSLMSAERQMILLWPTKRLDVARESALKNWIGRAENQSRVLIFFGIDQCERFDVRKIEEEYRMHVVETTKTRDGVAEAAFNLSSRLVANPGDVVILASDDFDPPQNWDIFLEDQFKGWNGAICVNNGVPPYLGPVSDIPIMDYACLQKLRGIMYHPAYSHCYSDNELYDILKEKDLLKDLRGTDTPVFIHRHWRLGLRDRDGVDSMVDYMSVTDFQTYHSRSRLSIGSKLSVEKEKFVDRFDILRCIKSDSVCAEVGVYTGDFAEAIASKNPRLLYCVDSWRKRDDYFDHMQHDQNHWDAMYAGVSKRFEGKPSVILCRMDSIEAANTFKDGYFDFVYIDADHTYEKVMMDLRGWWKKLRSGGVMAGHDYKFESVYQAVQDFMIEIGINQHLFFVTEDVYPSWVIKKEVIQ